MNLIERKTDVVTGSVDMENLHTMENFPVFMGCVDHARDQDLFADLAWDINIDSGLIQLKKLIPLDILYQSQHSGSVGGVWMSHHRAFAGFLEAQSPKSVLELGGAHGILSMEYMARVKLPWTILEPNPAPVDGCEAIFIKGYFDESFKYSAEFDSVVHSHVFEHVYDPNKFMKYLSEFMATGKKLVFSLPNMKAMLERNYTNCLNFEHTVFLTEPYIEFLLAKYGFKMLAKEYFMDNHSIFYAAIREDGVTALELPKGLYEKNKKLYEDYVLYHSKLVHELNVKIGSESGPVYLFGAHVFSQYLIQTGLNTEKIINLLDNDPKKQGRRLYGTGLSVESPEILRHIKNPKVILKAGVYNEEIKSAILNEINNSTVFLD